MPLSSVTRPQPLTHDDLVQFFVAGEKAPGRWRIGLEHEKLAVFPDGRPVPYQGPAGIAALLRGITRPRDTPLLDGDQMVGLVRGREKITVEPGGQVEMAGAPARSVRAAQTLLVRHMRVLRRVGQDLGIHFISGGFRPWGSLDDVTWLPKRRYDIMRAYLPTRGRLAAEMMKRTATLQANLDYSSEADAASRMRTANAVTSVVTAMVAASPISAGRPNGFKSYRAAVWTETDEDRCGLSPFVFDTDAVYGAYVQWALDVPMFFIERDGVYLPAQGMTFRQFMAAGHAGYEATLDDWRLHLSTLFPEVRLKHTIELRGADAGPLPIVLGASALWRGVLDDREARQAAFELVADVPFAARVQARMDVPRAALHARLGRHSIADLALRLCQIAREGLRRLATTGGNDDRILLDPLEDLTRAGRCPADDMLDDFQETGGDPADLIKRWEHPA